MIASNNWKIIFFAFILTCKYCFCEVVVINAGASCPKQPSCENQIKIEEKKPVEAQPPSNCGCAAVQAKADNCPDVTIKAPQNSLCEYLDTAANKVGQTIDTFWCGLMKNVFGKDTEPKCQEHLEDNSCNLARRALNNPGVNIVYDQCDRKTGYDIIKDKICEEAKNLRSKSQNEYEDCKEIRGRKEVRDLTHEELEDLKSALYTIVTTKEANSTETIYQRFVSRTKRGRKTGMVNGSDSLLAWNRKLLYELENELRKVNPKVSLPYWDWSIDSQAPERSIIFSKEYFGTFAEIGGCVESALLSGIGCVKRHWKDGVIPSLPSPEVLRVLLGVATSYEDLNARLELIQSVVQVSIGGIAADSQPVGDLATENAANDPLFWLISCFTDKLWAVALQRNQCVQIKEDLPLWGFDCKSKDVEKIAKLCYVYMPSKIYRQTARAIGCHIPRSIKVVEQEITKILASEKNCKTQEPCGPKPDFPVHILSATATCVAYQTQTKFVPDACSGKSESFSTYTSSYDLPPGMCKSTVSCTVPSPACPEKEGVVYMTLLKTPTAEISVVVSSTVTSTRSEDCLFKNICDELESTVNATSKCPIDQDKVCSKSPNPQQAKCLIVEGKLCTEALATTSPNCIKQMAPSSTAAAVSAACPTSTEPEWITETQTICEKPTEELSGSEDFFNESGQLCLHVAHPDSCSRYSCNLKKECNSTCAAPPSSEKPQPPKDSCESLKDLCQKCKGGFIFPRTKSEVETLYQEIVKRFKIKSLIISGSNRGATPILRLPRPVPCYFVTLNRMDNNKITEIEAELIKIIVILNAAILSERFVPCTQTIDMLRLRESITKSDCPPVANPCMCQQKLPEKTCFGAPSPPENDCNVLRPREPKYKYSVCVCSDALNALQPLRYSAYIFLLSIAVFIFA